MPFFLAFFSGGRLLAMYMNKISKNELIITTVNAFKTMLIIVLIFILINISISRVMIIQMLIRKPRLMKMMKTVKNNTSNNNTNMDNDNKKNNNGK